MLRHYGYLVVNVCLTQVTPHRQVTEAQDHRVFRHNAVSHHVLINITATEHLRQDGAQVRHMTSPTAETEYIMMHR